METFHLFGSLISSVRQAGEFNHTVNKYAQVSLLFIISNPAAFSDWK